MFLMIQNYGTAPVEAYTTLGISTTRDSDVTNTIGQFGSGTKHSINVCLRNSLQPQIFSGLDKLLFDTMPYNVDDGIESKTFHKVRYSLNNNPPQDMGFVSEYGAQDWNDISMAIREFVSNAIDRTLREKHDLEEDITCGKLQVIPTQKAEGKEGFTRVFIPWSSKIQGIFCELPKRFLHFKNIELLNKTVIAKENDEGARIYKNGVYVRTVSIRPKSVFDYNFGNDLKLDECRNVNDYHVVAEFGSFISNKACANTIAQIMERCLCSDKYMESRCHYLFPYIIKEERRAVWKNAWKILYGDRPATNNNDIYERTKKKGFQPVMVTNELWYDALKKYGIPNASSYLSQIEQNGYSETLATSTVRDTLEDLWNWLVTNNLVQGIDKPAIKCFEKPMNSGTIFLGKYENNTIYINNDISDGEKSTQLYKTVLEELVHHITGATDMSRDFQEFLLSVAIKGMVNNCG